MNQQQTMKLVKDEALKNELLKEYLEECDQVGDYSWVRLIELPNGEEHFVEILVKAKKPSFDIDEAIEDFIITQEVKLAKTQSKTKGKES